MCSIAFARLDVTPRHERLRNRNWEKVLSTPINLDLLRQGLNLGRERVLSIEFRHDYSR